MAATGWLVAALLLTLGIACGLGWLAARERRLRHQAEADAYSERARADARTRSLEARDAELAAAHTERILAQRAAREATERLRVATLSDQQVAGELPAALAALRARRAGVGADPSRGDSLDLATSPTLDDLPAVATGLVGLAARESAGGSPALRPGGALPGGVGGPGGVGRALTR